MTAHVIPGLADSEPITVTMTRIEFIHPFDRLLIRTGAYGFPEIVVVDSTEVLPRRKPGVPQHIRVTVNHGGVEITRPPDFELPVLT
jgi:hypothetical protein